MNNEMEKKCEFCKLYKPVVYCKSDAAHLCLSCDSKVHSANALSSRHPRTLICESCRYRPAHVRCSDHQMFMCRGCDCSHHDFSSDHEKKLISCYIGSPSAKELAALWGFDLNEFENSTLFVSTSDNMNVARQFCSQSGSSSVVSTIESLTTNIAAKSTVRSKSKHIKAIRKAIEQDKNSTVLQQILDLKRLQLSESMHVREPTDESSFKDGTTRKLRENNHNNLSQQPDLQYESGDLNDETTEKPFPLPFSQLDQLTDTGNGDSFWQCKSPLQNNQLWPQNMQDLGVCDELRYVDDFNMPDFDSTFKNFEEMFGSDQDPTESVLDDNDMTCSSVVKFASLEKDSRITNQTFQFKESLTQIRPSYSALSFSHSRYNAESNTYEYVDSGNNVVRSDHAPHTTDAENAHLEDGEAFTVTHREKNSRRHEKQSRRASFKKSKSDVKKRVEGLSTKAEGLESNTVNVSRSF